MARGRKKGSKDTVKRVRRTKKQVQEEQSNLTPAVEETVEQVIPSDDVNNEVGETVAELDEDVEEIPEDYEDDEITGYSEEEDDEDM